MTTTPTTRDVIQIAETAPTPRERFNASVALMIDLANLLDNLPKMIPGNDHVQAIAEYYARKFHQIACEPETGELVPYSTPPPWQGAMQEAERQGSRLPLAQDDEEAAGDLEDDAQHQQEEISAYLESRFPGGKAPDPAGHTDAEIARILGVKRPMGPPPGARGKKSAT